MTAREYFSWLDRMTAVRDRGAVASLRAAVEGLPRRDPDRGTLLDTLAQHAACLGIDPAAPRRVG